jgi:anaerobic ribonucleoside-triphosphate reductase activating protein
MMLSPQEVLERILLENITGLTFSGGEPMMQASGLAELARLARQQKDLDIICFTGFRYERLLKNPPAPGISDLLAQTDVLIDGPFVQSLHDSIGLRGSSNQRILHLTPRLKQHDLESQTRSVEITISDGEFGLIGIPTPAMLSALRTTPYAGMERMG